MTTSTFRPDGRGVPTSVANHHVGQYIMATMARKWMGASADQWDLADPSDFSPIAAALKAQGVETINHFLMLTYSQIDSMTYQFTRGSTATVETAALAVAQKQIIKAAYSCYHYLSVINRGPIGAEWITSHNFNEYVSTKFNPHKEPKPWHEEEDKELSHWKKSVIGKPTRSDFPIIKDDAQHFKWKKDYLLAASNAGLLTTLEPCVPVSKSDQELDEGKCQWMMLTLTKTIQSSNGKAILQKYRDSNNTRAFWKEYNKFIETSIAGKNRKSTLCSLLPQDTREHRSWSHPILPYPRNYQPC